MSLRPREAYESAQQFSLHSALGGVPPATVPLQARPNSGLSFDLGAVQHLQHLQQRQPAHVAAAAPAVVQAPSGLSLRFGGGTQHAIGSAFHAAQPVSPLAAAPQHAFHAHGIPPASMPPLTFTTARPASSLSSSQTATRDAAVMRLTAQVDDLTSKLKKAQNRLVQTEAQLTRTSHVLCSERQSSEKAIQSFKKDIVTARDAETKLRTELTSTKKSTLKSSAFMASVGSALASDEQIQSQQRSMQELETKVTALGEFKVKLETEVGTLQTERAEVQKVLDAARVEQEEHSLKAKAATAKMTGAQAEMETMTKEHALLTEKLAAARVEEATVSETVSALHVTSQTMDSENAKVGASIQAMLLEHGDASRTLAEVRARVLQLETKEASLTTRVAAAAAAAPQLPAAPLASPAPPAARRRGAVTGAASLQQALCTGMPTQSVASQAAHWVDGTLSRIAAPLAIDSPVDLALQRVAFVGSNHVMVLPQPTGGARKEGTADDEDRTTAMVTAVVGDLKTRLTEISMQEPVWRSVAPLV